MTARIAALAAFGALLLAAPALADRAADGPLRAPRTLTTHHVAFTLPGGRWLQEINVFGGAQGLGHYRRSTNVDGGAECTLTATVIAKSRRTALVASRGKVALSAGDALTVRRQGRHGAVRWWSGRRGSNGASALGSQRLPSKLVRNGRRHLDYRVTIQHFAEQPGDHDACYALARAVSVRVAQTMRIAGGPAVSRAPFVDGQARIG
ncbi:MAG TPA: hypothetical protein VGO80_19355 [Solirubrobacteraceae bacterium]|nr:hypothetical protein [Solirubrobacteraceae bacterium]